MFLICGNVGSLWLPYEQSGWSEHDHLVSEGRAEPLAYILASSAAPWLSV
jgi:hypothetical protein